MKQDSYVETSYETIKKKETISVLVLETFEDFYDQHFIKQFRELQKESNLISLSSSYQTLRISEDLEEEITGRMKVDEEILVKIKDDFFIKNY